MISHRTFILRKVHSLAGVIPLSIFLALHMFLNSYSLKGPEAYNKIINGMQSLPYILLIELTFIILPLSYHAIYGIWISWIAKSNVLRYSYYRNWMFYLQRAAGIVTFIFVSYHVYELRVRNLLFGQEASFDQMAALVHNPVMFAFYLIGLVAAIYHFANGLFTFCISWGITVGPNSQRVANLAVWVIFVVMLAVGINALLGFR